MRSFRIVCTSLALTLGSIAFTGAAMAEIDRRGDCDHKDHSPGDCDRDRNGHGNDNGKSGHGVPEIDPGSIGSALALLGFTSAMLFDRRRPK